MKSSKLLHKYDLSSDGFENNGEETGGNSFALELLDTPIQSILTLLSFSNIIFKNPINL